MCGIIAVVPRPSGRTPPVANLLASVENALSNALEAEASVPASRLKAFRWSREQLEAIDAQLRGSVGLRWMLDDPDRLEALDRRAGEFEAWLAKLEDRMDPEAAEALVDTAEQTNEALARLKDGLWRIRRDRIAAAWAIATLAGPDPKEPRSRGSLRSRPPCRRSTAWRSGDATPPACICWSIDTAWISTTPRSPPCWPDAAATRCSGRDRYGCQAAV
jgi:hypothetical protein